MTPARDTPARGRFWLILVGTAGALVIVLMLTMLGGLTPPALFLLASIAFVVVCIWAVLEFAGPVLWPVERVAAPPTPIWAGQVWRDRIAPGELVRVVRLGVGDNVIITRIAGTYPTSHGKRFTVTSEALCAGFEPIE